MTAQAEKVARIFSWLAVIVIIILSVVPGDMRPHTRATGHLEHIAAYFITAALLTFSYNARHSPAFIVVGLSSLSGLMEILQIFIPGRHAGFDDFVVSSIGTVIGLVLASLFLRFFRHS